MDCHKSMWTFPDKLLGWTTKNFTQVFKKDEEEVLYLEVSEKESTPT